MHLETSVAQVNWCLLLASTEPTRRANNETNDALKTNTNTLNCELADISAKCNILP